MKLSDAEISSLLFAETADASIPTPAAGKLRLFVDDDGLFKWKDEAGVVSEFGGGASDLDGLSDVDVSSTPPTDGQALVYDTGDSLWKPAAVAAGAAGGSELIYRYTVTGADKASIDTDVDTADAGSLDWADGDLLEVFLAARTDEASNGSGVNVNANNSAAAIYDLVNVRDTNATVAGGNALAQTTWTLTLAGDSNAAGIVGLLRMTFPNYCGTVLNKVATFESTNPSNTAADIRVVNGGLGLRTTSAITRLAFTPTTALKKFKIGTQLLILKRRDA